MALCDTSDSDSETGDTAIAVDAAHQQLGQSVTSSLDSGSRKVEDKDDTNGKTPVYYEK